MQYLHRTAKLESVLDLLIPYLSFLDLLQLRAVCKGIEERMSQCEITVEKYRSKVHLSQYGGQLLMQLGSAKQLRYTEGCAPRIARLFGKIRADELRIVVQDSDDQTLDFYEEMAAKCDFDVLHLTIGRSFAADAMPRMQKFIRAHAAKKVHLVFQTADNVDLEMLRTIEHPATVYFHQTMSLDVGLLLDLIAAGHTLEMVRTEGMSMDLVRQIAEMLAANHLDQLASMDVPLAIFDVSFSQSRPLGSDGGEWTFDGSVMDKLTVHRKWSREKMRLRESRRRTENDEWYMPAVVETRLVLANCDKESIAGVVYPHACPPDEPETIAEELQEIGARLMFSAKRYFGYR